MTAIEPRTIDVGTRVATVRLAQESDADGMLALLKATAQESDFLSRYPDEIRWTPQEHAGILQRKLGSPVNCFIVAEMGQRVVGFASLEGATLRRFEHGASLSVTILRELWGHGLGRALVETLVSWADSRGLVRISLEVVEHNVRAIRLYESLGFQHEGRLRACRKHGDAYLDSLIMSRLRHQRGPA